MIPLINYHMFLCWNIFIEGMVAPLHWVCPQGLIATYCIQGIQTQFKPNGVSQEKLPNAPKHPQIWRRSHVAKIDVVGNHPIMFYGYTL